MSTENFKEGCLQRDSAEPELLEAILDKRNMNKAYKRVKANKGAPGIDGMTIEEAFSYIREHKDELIGRIKRGKYTPSPVRRVEIPKPDGGIRKLGIPTVIDRIIQQAISQKLMPIYEPLFSNGSYGYRPGRSAKDAIEELNGWLYHRIRMCIWKMWKRPRSKMKYLMKLGVPAYYAHMAANSRRGYWFTSATSTVNRALSKEILVRKGFYDLADAYQQMHVNY